MSGHQRASVPTVDPRPEIGPGTILVDGAGRVRLIRSRTKAGTGWNCADGAAIDDAVAEDAEVWTAYTPDLLAADLELAREVRDLSGHRALGGGIATWDACSGRPCILPKLARLVQGRDRTGAIDWTVPDDEC